ncbi:hypothetical protein D9M69_444050 [compost metagenome]
MLVAVRDQLVDVGQLRRLLAKHAQDARTGVLRHFEGLVVSLPVLEADAPFSFAACRPIDRATVRVQVADGVADPLSRKAAQIGKDVALPYSHVRGQIDTLNRAAIRNPVTGTRPGSPIPQKNLSATGKRRQPVLSQQRVVNRDALLNRRVAKQVVQAVDFAGVALDADLTTLNADLDRGRVATLMLEPGLPSAEHFVGIGVDGQREHVAHDRKVVMVFLRNAQPIDEHRNPCQYRETNTQWTES